MNCINGQLVTPKILTGNGSALYLQNISNTLHYLDEAG